MEYRAPASLVAPKRRSVRKHFALDMPWAKLVGQIAQAYGK
jgi:hypothetical protein